MEGVEGVEVDELMNEFEEEGAGQEGWKEREGEEGTGQEKQPNGEWGEEAGQEG